MLMSFFERFINKGKRKSEEELRIEKINNKLPYGVHVKVVGQLPDGIAIDGVNSNSVERIKEGNNDEKTDSKLHIVELKEIAKYISYPEIALQVAKYVKEGRDLSYILGQLRWSGLSHLGRAVIPIISQLDNPTLKDFESLKDLHVGGFTKEQEFIFNKYMKLKNMFTPFLETYGFELAKDTMTKPLIYARGKTNTTDELLVYASWAKLRGDKEMERLILSTINDYYWDEIKKEEEDLADLIQLAKNMQNLKVSINIDAEQWIQQKKGEIENMNTQNLLTTDYLGLDKEYYVIDVTGVVFPIAAKTSPVVQFVTQCGSRVHFLMENAGRFNLERACEIIESGILGTVGLALVPADFFEKKMAQPNEAVFYQYATLRYYDPTIAEWTERFNQLKENGVFITENTMDGTSTLELFTDIASLYNNIQKNSNPEMDVRSMVIEAIKNKSFEITPNETLKCLVAPNFLPEIKEVRVDENK